eukprot:Clim_evm5s102 gene=Clim_evmTU5s102
MEPEFEVGKVLGKGRYAKVYIATDKKSGKTCALKLLRKADLNPRQTRRVYSEIQIATMLQHPNICSVYRHVENSEYFMLAMELMTGGELFDAIKARTYFYEDEARDLFLQTGSAVQFMHKNGVVHRDLKPENILLVKPGEPLTIKIADFGVSKIVWDKPTETPCGTVGYAAPEVMSKTWHTTKTDMWSMGCILYTVLAGFPPFYHQSNAVLLDMVRNGDYTFPSPWWDEVSDSAKNLISHLLEVDMEKRFTIEEMIAHEWMRVGVKQQVGGSSADSAEAKKNLRNSLMSPDVSKMFDAEYGINDVFTLANAAERVREGNQDDDDASDMITEEDNSRFKAPDIKLNMKNNPLLRRRASQGGS